MRHLRLMALIAVLGVFLSFNACGGLVAKAQTVNFLVVYDDVSLSFSVSGEIATVEDAMALLSNKGEGFSYKEDNSVYGAYIVSVCGRDADGAAGEWWGVYTDTVTDYGNGILNVIQEYTYAYGDDIFYSTALGISGQAVSDGETILLVLSAGY